jgi:hypothetical protein
MSASLGDSIAPIPWGHITHFKLHLLVTSNAMTLGIPRLPDAGKVRPRIFDEAGECADLRRGKCLTVTVVYPNGEVTTRFSHRQSFNSCLALDAVNQEHFQCQN